jgi:hypothetical protein
MKELKCHIRENSIIARIAAWKLGSDRVAIVIGRTIHLHNASKLEFLHNESWLRHEMAHIKQFQQHGFFPFLLKYLAESIRSGYLQNKFEVEARKAEKNERIAEGIIIH